MANRAQPPRRAAGQKQNTFFGGAAILAVGILVVKLIGMFYKIPLTNIIGEQGNADFNNAYYIYSVLLTISTAGLPVAVSKLVSEANALGRRNQVHKTFRLSMLLFLSLGVISFLVMFFRADLLAGLMNDDKAAAGIRALAPAVICVGCLAALRGYSQGHSDMTPTSVSQIIEALCKLVVGLSLAYWLINAGQTPDVAAAGAITGVTVGTVVALAYMVLSYGFGRAREPRLSRDVPDGAGSILKDILRIAIPITLSSSMVGIVTVIDSSLVQGQLQRVLVEDPASWALYADFVDFGALENALNTWKATLAAGAAADMASLNQQMALEAPPAAAHALNEAVQDISRTLYGNYSGALNIYNLPTSLMAAVTAAVIPAVSGALARRDRRGAARVTGSALRITALVAFPMGVGLFVLGEPIMRLLFTKLNSELAGPLLSTLGLATVFVCMMLVCNSILQAHGFVNLPVLVMVLGGRAENFHQLQPGGPSLRRNLRRPHRQHFVLCPVPCAGPADYLPGHPQPASVWPYLPQAAGRLCPDGGRSLGGIRPAGPVAQCGPRGGDGGGPQQDGQRGGHPGGHRSGYGGLSGAGGGPAGHLPGGPVPDAQGG